jgi:hypothetical protein
VRARERGGGRLGKKENKAEGRITYMHIQARNGNLTHGVVAS